MDKLMNAAYAAHINNKEYGVCNIILKPDKEESSYLIECDVLSDNIITKDDVNKNIDAIVASVFDEIEEHPTFQDNPSLIHSLRVSYMRYKGKGKVKAYLSCKCKENTITAEMRAKWCETHYIQYIVLDERTENIIGFILNDNSIHSIHDAVILSLEQGNGLLFVRQFCGEFMFTICVEEKHGRKIPYFKMHSKEKLVERYPDIFVLGTVSGIRLSDNKSLVNMIKESSTVKYLK